MLDQVLNVCERYPDAHPLWLRLLELYHAPANTLCQILGRKFQTTKVSPKWLAQLQSASLTDGRHWFAPFVQDSLTQRARRRSTASPRWPHGCWPAASSP